MYENIPQRRKLLKQPVFDTMPNAVAFIDRELRIDFDVNVREVFQT